MMREAPEVLRRPVRAGATPALYGVPDGDTTSFAYQCLIARRLVERGVRVVEMIDSGSSNNWDAHGDMQDHRPKAARVDRAIAALIQDLKSSGLLERDARGDLHRVRPHPLDRRPRQRRAATTTPRRSARSSSAPA